MDTKGHKFDYFISICSFRIKIFMNFFVHLEFFIIKMVSFTDCFNTNQKLIHFM